MLIPMSLCLAIFVSVSVKGVGEVVAFWRTERFLFFVVFFGIVGSDNETRITI